MTDVCVVGGGPAGLATAIAIRRHGGSVTVIDCSTPPINKPCGEGLMPDSVTALRDLGVALPANIGFNLRGIRFADKRSSVCAQFPNGVGIGVRRTVLHALLVQQAQDVGVQMIWNAKGVRLRDDGVLIGRDLCRADFVVGADGQNSQIRRQAGLGRVAKERRRYGFRRHYRIALWSEYMELHWGPRGQAYVTPIAEDEICLVMISRHKHLRLEDALLDFPELNRRLTSGMAISSEMGSLSISRRLERVCRDRVALVGDASGSVDAITGEGMSLSFKQAAALASAFCTGKLNDYQKAHERLSSRPLAMESLMLALERRQGFQRRVLASLASHEGVFAALLSVHVGESSFLDLCSWRLVPFGLKFLAA
ncbi:MAG: NAD(P)/FAD-dependent oxidoreductase [Acidobacteriaceae bacterium]|nr:NAD(P)/FAD-dependent oxidoreductase [Acidobacteriaceae bacterium]